METGTGSTADGTMIEGVPPNALETSARTGAGVGGHVTRMTVAVTTIAAGETKVASTGEGMKGEL